MRAIFGRLSTAVTTSWAKIAPLASDRGASSVAAAPRRRHGFCLLAACAWLVAPLVAAHANQFVRLDYNLTLATRSRDTVFIELFDDRPLTTANFLQYVNADLYDGTLMHRLARNFVVQGGGFYPVFIDEPPPVHISLDPTATVDLDGNPATPNPTVMNEFDNTPTRSNLRGTIAMAKVGGLPDSATNQWFVNLLDNTGLDTNNGGFTVFARVLGDGMAIFDAFNTLLIDDLNPDVNDDGVRDGGPFFNPSAPLDINGQPTDGVPFLRGIQGDLLLLVEDAEQVDYLGNGLTTDVPLGGLAFGTRDAFIDTGTIFTGPGPLTIGADRTLGIREGVSLNRPLINQGTLEPGLQLGSITVQSYQQAAGGTLDIQLRGVTADPEHDRLVVTGAATLNGTLDVSLLSGFIPEAGDSFTVLTAGSITGAFSAVELPLLSDGLVWNVNRSSTAVTLAVALADYNRNGVVDAADYVLWRKTFGQTGTGLLADGNGDNEVDHEDYSIWRSHFGNTAGTATGSGSLAPAAVPEPSAAWLLLIAGFLAAARCRIRGADIPVCRL